MNKRLTAKQRMEARPMVAIENHLFGFDADDIAATHWKNAILAFTKKMRNFTTTLEDFHRICWGNQNKIRPYRWTGEFRFDVYETPTYRVLVNNTKGICLEVPTECTRDQALDAMGSYLNTIGVGEKECPLPYSEFLNLMSLGANAVRGKEMDFTNIDKDQETLRKFVIGYCDGVVWTSETVDPGMISTVFLPIMFGALDLPKELVAEITPKLPQDLGTRETFAEPEPTDEEPPKLPPKPQKPKVVEPDPVQVDKLERREFFNTSIPGESLTTYMADIDAKNAEVATKYNVELSTWGSDNAPLLERQEAIIKANVERKAAWAERKKVAEDTHAFDMAEARYNIAQAGARMQYWKDMGCIWEATGDRNTAHRSVNGMPMFYSCRFMSKAAMARASVAIDREMEHRKSMVI